MGHAKVSLPGGDDFGSRPIDIHLRALTELGATFTNEHGYIEGRADRLVGARVVFDFPSHTATDNVLMAAVLAKGTSVIENAAREPEVQDLAAFLTAMGAKIQGAGTSRIEIEGVDALQPAAHVCVPDRVEAATFLIATAMTGGEVRVLRAIPSHMDMLLEKLVGMGAEIDRGEGCIAIRASGRLDAVDLATLPYPGVATDYKRACRSSPRLSIAAGVSIASENLFAGRFPANIDELRRMGAEHPDRGAPPRSSAASLRSPARRSGLQTSAPARRSCSLAW